MHTCHWHSLRNLEFCGKVCVCVYICAHLNSSVTVPYVRTYIILIIDMLCTIRSCQLTKGLYSCSTHDIGRWLPWNQCFLLICTYSYIYIAVWVWACLLQIMCTMHAFVRYYLHEQNCAYYKIRSKEFNYCRYCINMMIDILYWLKSAAHLHLLPVPTASHADYRGREWAAVYCCKHSGGSPQSGRGWFSGGNQLHYKWHLNRQLWQSGKVPTGASHTDYRGGEWAAVYCSQSTTVWERLGQWRESTSFSPQMKNLPSTLYSWPWETSWNGSWTSATR